MAKIKAIRGMHDILPDQTPYWQYLERVVADTLRGYGYSQIRLPIVEVTELFKRSIGEVTDIVEKEMYTFDDRNGDSMTLRPEGTAGCVRACEEHGLLYNQIQRVWYQGPMFRYERPQKGRQRQFHQIGVESFGMASAEADAEVILLSARLWKVLGLAEHVTLELNSIGTLAARNRYKAALVDYLLQHRDALDEDSQRRLESNPLRILDSKSSETQQILEGAPKLSAYLDEESSEHHQLLKRILDKNGIRYLENERLVRGLDYYSKTVFEWTTERLGAQGTVCAGGRYDGLVEQLGGRPTPAVGFAMGVERLVLLLEETGALPGLPEGSADIYLVVGDLSLAPEAAQLAEQVRDRLPGKRVVVNCNGGSFKSQMKKADKSGAVIALILAEDEMKAGEVTLKPLRDLGGEQQRVSLECVIDQLGELLA